MKKLTLLLSILFLSECVNDSEPESIVSVGDDVPTFEIELNNGSKFGREQMKGKTTHLIFFNTTCADCQRELPILQQEYEAVDTQTTQFICIAREEGATEIAKYWSENGFTMPWSAQTDRKVYNLFALSGIPRTYIVNPDLIIIRIM